MSRRLRTKNALIAHSHTYTTVARALGETAGRDEELNNLVKKLGKDPMIRSFSSRCFGSRQRDHTLAHESSLMSILDSAVYFLIAIIQSTSCSSVSAL